MAQTNILPESGTNELEVAEFCLNPKAPFLGTLNQMESCAFF